MSHSAEEDKKSSCCSLKTQSPQIHYQSQQLSFELPAPSTSPLSSAAPAWVQLMKVKLWEITSKIQGTAEDDDV